MSTGQRTILLHFNTFPTLGKSANMHCCPICQKAAAPHKSEMLSATMHKATTTPLPTQITPDVWILATPASAPTDTISVICPEKPMETIPIRQPLHILKLPTACSATTSHFYLPLRYESPVLNINVSLDMANLQAINITALHFHAFGNTWGGAAVTPSYNTLQV